MNNWYLFAFGIILIILGIYFLVTKRKEELKTLIEQKEDSSNQEEQTINIDEVEETSHSFDVSSAFDKFKKKK